MIRRSPCELYLKHLVVHPDRYSDDQIVRMARLQHLDPIGPGYIDKLRRITIPPAPFYPYNSRHEPSNRFLLRHRIWQFYHPSSEMEEAFKLLEHARAKELIETMVLTRSDTTWIVSALNRIGISASVEVIELYRKHFWDIDLLDSTEMKTLLGARVDLMGTDPSQLESYMKNFRLDPRMMAAEMPIPSLATMMNMMRMGFMPSHVEVTRVAATARTAATVRTLESVMRGGSFDHERGQAYANIAMTMTNMIESVGSPEEELQHQMTLLLKTDDTTPPDIHQLTGGQHTVDVQPIMTSEEPEIGNVK